MIYFFVLIPVSILGYLYNSKYSRFCLFFAVVAISLFAAGRNETGNDWQEYAKYYDLISECNDINCALVATRLEPGFVLAAFSLSSYLSSYKDFLFIVAFFSVLGFFKASHAYGAPLLLILIGYLRFEYLQTNFMFARQGISLVFFVYSIRYIKEENFAKYSLINFVGASFHTLSLALLPLYFFMRKSFGFGGHYFLLAVAIVLMAFNVDLLRAFANIFAFESISSLILSYLDSEVWGESATISVSLLEKIIILVAGVAKREKISSAYKYYDIFLKLHFICISVWFVTFTAYVFNERFSVFTNIGQIFLLAYIVSSIRNTFWRFISITVLLWWCYLFLLKALFLSTGSEFYHPYSNFIFAL